MRKLKGILFDNDGTLVDTHDLILESFQYTTEKLLGYVVTDEQVLATGGRPLDEQMLIFAKGDAELASEMSRVYREYNHAIHDERVKLFDGVATGLEALREAGFALGIATSKRHWLTERGLKVCAIDQHFTTLVGADDCEHHKPHAAPLRMAAANLGLDANDCAYVGDSPLDIRAAKNASCMSIAALWGMFSAHELAAEQPDMACASFTEFVSSLL